MDYWKETVSDHTLKPRRDISSFFISVKGVSKKKNVNSFPKKRKKEKTSNTCRNHLC